MAMHQKSMQSFQMELSLAGGDEVSKGQRSDEAGRATHGEERSGSDHSIHHLMTQLMERVIERKNAIEALKRVRRNKGSPGCGSLASQPCSIVSSSN